MRTSWNKKVSKKVCSLVTSGRMAKEVSPTSPRVTLFNASVFTGSPSLGATAENVRKFYSPWNRIGTEEYSRGIKARSVNEYIAQIFGAQ